MEIAGEMPPCGGLPRETGQDPESGGIGCLPAPAVAQPRSKVDDAKLAEFVDAAERFRPQLLWVATRLTNRPEEAEDILQQALLKAFVNLSGFRGESQMRTWLTAIVQNTAREHLRRQRGRVFVPLESVPFPDGSCGTLDLPDPSMNAEEHYELREREEITLKAVSSISRANRRVLRMCVFEDLPYIRVATVLNVSLSTVKSRISRGKRVLRMAISRITDRPR